MANYTFSVDGPETASVGNGDVAVVNDPAFFDTTDTVTGVGGSVLRFDIGGDLVLDLTGYAGITGFSNIIVGAAGSVDLTIGQDFYAANALDGALLSVDISIPAGSGTIDAGGISGAIIMTSYGASNDVLTGGAGNDNLIGGAGADQLNGGAGDDLVLYTTAAAAVVANLQAGGSQGDALGDVFSGIEGLIGSAYDDTLIGDAGANALGGGTGNDNLLGGGGADRLDGGVGDFDTVAYTGSAAAVTVDLSLGTGQGGDAEGDTVSGVESIGGSAFDDTLIGNGGANVLAGGAGDDRLVGGAGADGLYGGIFPAIPGDYGIDTADYSASAAGVTVDLVSGTGHGGDAEGDTLAEIENLTGSAFADQLFGDGGANALIGGAGNDILTGGGGADRFDGGDGDFDTVAYTSSTAAVTIDLSLGTGQGGDAEGDTFSGVENIGATAFNDILIGDGGANALAGGAGDDRLVGGAGADHLHGGMLPAIPGDFGIDTVDYSASAAGVTVDLISGTGHGGDAEGDTLVQIDNLVGSALVDRLSGDAGANMLDGGAGNDTLEGGAGGDTIVGGDGIDMASYFTSAAAVTVDLAAGTASGGDAAGDSLTGVEWLRGSAFNDSLAGDAGANLISGEGGDDTVAGGAGNDALYGEGGNDSINGGDGDDRLVGGDGADALVGGAGSDTAYYDNSYTTGVTANLADSSVNTGHAAGDTYDGVENLAGSSFADTLTGNDGVNLLSGWGGDDALNGGGGNDVLFGSDGVDTLNGGAGADKLYGGAGADVFVFSAAGDSGVGYSKADLITDFASGDRIDLSAILEGTGSFIGAAQFSREAGEIRAVSQDNQTSIFIDLTGDGTADMQIRLSGALTLTAGDFVL